VTLLVRHTDVLGGVVGGWNPLVPFVGWRTYEVTDTYVDPAGLELPAIRIRKISGPPTDTIAQIQARVQGLFIDRQWPMGGGLLRGQYPGVQWHFLDPATLALVAEGLMPIGNVRLGNLAEDVREKTPITEHVLQWFEHTLPTGPYIGIQTVRDPSTECPLWVSGHPVDIVAERFTAKGEAYDAASATACRAAMGTELQHILPITDPEQTPQDVADALGEAHRFAVRRSQTTGDAEFVYWGEKVGSISALPVIGMSEIREEGGPTFNLSDTSRLSRVRVTGQIVSKWQPGVVMVPVIKKRKFLGIPIGAGGKVTWVSRPANLSTDKPASGLVISSADVTFDYSTDGVTADSLVYGEQDADIDLGGMPAVTNSVVGGASPLNLEQWAEGLARLLFSAHSRGRQMATVKAIRGTDADQALLGEAITLDLDHLPNAQLGQSPTSQRGGLRPFRVIGRTEEMPGPVFHLADEGTGVQYATVPAFTAVVDPDNPGLWLVTVTNAGDLTADSAQVEFQCKVFAPAATPDFTDPGFRYTVDDATTWDTDPMEIRMGPFPIGHQVHFRARAWLFDSAASDWSAWDGEGGGGVTGSISTLVEGTVTSSSAAYTWTNTNTTSLVRVQLKLDAASDYSTVIDLPAGSTAYTFTGLTAEEIYDVRVILVQDGTEVGSALTDSFTADLAANQTQLDAPTSAQVFGGWNAATGTASPGTYGLEVTAVFGPPDMQIVFEEATETAVGSGTPGAYSIVLTTPAVIGDVTRYQANAPNDSKLRYLRAYAEASGYDDSDPTSALSVDPWPDTPTVPDPPSLTIGGMVPTHILSGESFTVPVRRQALFTVAIDNEGILLVDGVLEAVD
jgi:hypothetical protein